MRTRSTIAILPGVAIEAEDLEARRVVIVEEPPPHVSLPDHFAMGGTVTVDVIDRQKQWLRLTTAGAATSVVCEHGIPQFPALGAAIVVLLRCVALGVRSLPYLISCQYVRTTGLIARVGLGLPADLAAQPMILAERREVFPLATEFADFVRAARETFALADEGVGRLICATVVAAPLFDRHDHSSELGKEYTMSDDHPSTQLDVIEIHDLDEEQMDAIIAHQQDDPEDFAALWASKIVRYAKAPPESLTAHPGNWRIHSQMQQSALTTIMDRIGIIAPIIVNEVTGFIMDGHLRVSLALRRRTV